MRHDYSESDRWSDLRELQRPDVPKPSYKIDTGWLWPAACGVFLLIVVISLVRR